MPPRSPAQGFREGASDNRKADQHCCSDPHLHIAAPLDLADDAAFAVSRREDSQVADCRRLTDLTLRSVSKSVRQMSSLLSGMRWQCKAAIEDGWLASELATAKQAEAAARAAYERALRLSEASVKQPNLKAAG